MSNSVQPHRRQPTRLPRPWDSLGKNTGVGCHFLLQCMKVKSQSEVSQSCLTLRDPMDCSPPGSSVHGIFQARVLVVVYSFLFLSCIPLYGCTAVCLSSHWKIFELCTILGNCDWKYFKNSHAGVSMDLSAFFLDKYISLEMLGLMISIDELYKQLFSKQAIPYCVPASSVWEIQSLDLERGLLVLFLGIVSFCCCFNS